MNPGRTPAKSDDSIRDAIHGYITLEDWALDIVDTARFQRMRRIHQLGLTSLVYPSATHTRFEHSLGAYHLAKQITETVNVEDATGKAVRAAALLHDVGHGPFSHAAEDALKEHLPGHEELSITCIQDEYTDILTDHGIDPEQVCRLIRGDGIFGTVIAGTVDVDRMDYLMRDAYYTGVAPGMVEADTIIRNIRRKNREVVFHEKAVLGIESLLAARYFMIPKVYRHHAAVIAETMLKTAVQHLDTYDPEEIIALDDPSLVTALRTADSETAQTLMQRIDDRNLFKRAYVLPGREARRRDREWDADQLQQEISEESGVPPWQLAVATPPPTAHSDTTVTILDRDGNTQQVDAMSELCSILPRAERLHHPVLVATPQEKQGVVTDAATSLLGDEGKV